MAYSQATWGSYIQKLQDINEDHIAAISLFAIQHLLYQTGVVKAIIKEFLENFFQNHWKKRKISNLFEVSTTCWDSSIVLH